MKTASKSVIVSLGLKQDLWGRSQPFIVLPTPLSPGRNGFLIWFSRSVVSDSLPPHGLQHARPPCPCPSPEFAQVHVYCIGHTIQPSHPLTPSSPSALSLSQHQGLFQWVGYLYQVSKILELQLQHQSFQ